MPRTPGCAGLARGSPDSVACGPASSPWQAAGLALRPRVAASLVRLVPPAQGLRALSLALLRAAGRCGDGRARRSRQTDLSTVLSVWLAQAWNPLGLEVARSGWDGVVLTPESEPKRVPPPWSVWVVEIPWYNFRPKYFPARGFRAALPDLLWASFSGDR